MKTRIFKPLLLILAANVLLTSSLLAKEDFPDVTVEGLRKVADSDLFLVYAKDGVDLSVYNKVWLADATVAFQKDWKRDQNRSQSLKVTNRDMEKIQEDLARLFREIFTEELTEAGHDLVAEAGDDVLVVRPAIINLDVTAPATNRAGRGYTLAESAGQMTLYLELYDSVTRDLLVKALDQKADRSRSTFQWQTKGSNRAAASRALRDWAGTLASALSEAQDSADATD